MSLICFDSGIIPLIINTGIWYKLCVDLDESYDAALDYSTNSSLIINFEKELISKS
jgi:hypothetical protein